MVNKTIGMITGNFRCDALQTLSQTRSIAAVPFGGRYRLLDFQLSNMVNSGLRTVGIITPQQPRAILDQLGAGKSWFLDRKSEDYSSFPDPIMDFIPETINFH